MVGRILGGQGVGFGQAEVAELESWLYGATYQRVCLGRCTFDGRTKPGIRRDMHLQLRICFKPEPVRGKSARLIDLIYTKRVPVVVVPAFLESVEAMPG